MLIALDIADGYVHIYDCRTYELKVRLKRTKGCAGFAVARGIELLLPSSASAAMGSEAAFRNSTISTTISTQKNSPNI